MRLRRSNEGPVTTAVEVDVDPPVEGAWDGVLPKAAGEVRIKAPRAGDHGATPLRAA
jgi:hypothetical protein